MADLESIYRQTLHACDPAHIARAAVSRDMPRYVVAIGKCAGGLLDGVAESHDIAAAFAAIPHGYPAPRSQAEVWRGGHPVPDDASFEAGARLIEFVRQNDHILFLISGGGSACVEAALEPCFTRGDVVETSTRILSAGLSIGDINAVRKQLSAIKGGRLATQVRGRSVTLIYSDVGRDDRGSVASGPTVPDATTRHQAIAILQRVGGCDRIVTKLGDESLPQPVTQISNASATVIADNSTLVRTAARFAPRSVMIEQQIESDVESAAKMLAHRAQTLEPGQVLIAGGETTVVAHGPGKGGRCLEMAVRFALASDGRTIALFGSSDGVDGNSGVAGALADREPADREFLRAALERSDSLSAVGSVGRPLIIPPTGNNLRDLYLLARR